METRTTAPMESQLTDIEGLCRAGFLPNGRGPSVRTLPARTNHHPISRREAGHFGYFGRAEVALYIRTKLKVPAVS
jgi:hypothetical protein